MNSQKITEVNKKTLLFFTIRQTLRRLLNQEILKKMIAELIFWVSIIGIYILIDICTKEK